MIVKYNASVYTLCGFHTLDPSPILGPPQGGHYSECLPMATSARKENRWRKHLKQTADAEADRRRELEILSLARAPRAPIIPPPNHSRRQVIAWMRRNAHEYETATHLAEAANTALSLPPEAMDDETHWIWDEAANAIK